MKKLTKTLIIGAAVGISGIAQAAFIDVVPNTTPAASLTTIPDFNDYAAGTGHFVFPQEYNTTDQVLLSHSVTSTSADPFKLTFTYLGKEAGYINSFLYEGTEIFNTGSGGTGTGGTPLGTTYSTIYTAGTGRINFGFSSNAYGTPGGSVSNLGIDNVAPGYNFNIFQGKDFMILSLDDNNQVDDNHDDMLVMVKASKVPEPGTLALLGLGLVGLGLRRKTRK